MRIGIDANPVFRSRAGIGNYVARMAERMSALSPDDEFRLYFWGDEPDLSEAWLRRGNVVVRRVPKGSFAAEVKKDRVDVFHGTNFRLRAAGEKASVLSIHDLALKIFPQLRRRWPGDWLGFLKMRRDARRADRIIAISARTGEDIVRHMGIPPEKVRVTLLAAGDEFRPDPDRAALSALLLRLGFSRPRYVLFSGTIEPRKNVMTLLDAYRRLRADFPDTGLILAGAPGWKCADVLESIRSGGLEGEVKITGYLGTGELATLYSGAAAYALPSLYEGFGLTVVEAMACGAPVVTSTGGSLPEIVGDAAAVLEPTDAEGFRREIARLLSDEAHAREMRARGFRRAAQFSWDRTAEGTLAVYREVLGLPGRAS